MFRSFELTFPGECQEFVKKAYSEASLIVEYGSGGSTLYAAETNKKVITVESSSEWLIELMGAYKEQDLPGDIIPIWVDVGKTEEWGYPADESEWKMWSCYAVKPWEYCAEHLLQPDMVLIDGRFRVACFIASCVHIKIPTTILIDDFAERPEYHFIKEIVEPDAIIGDRLAVFSVQPNMIDTNFLLQNISYFYNPE